MKKKRNFLTIISSLFGVAAICGLSLFSLLDHKKESQRAEAYSNISAISLQNGNGAVDSFTLSGVIVPPYNNYDGQPNSSYYFKGSYTLRVYYTGIGSYQKMDFSMNVSCYIKSSTGTQMALSNKSYSVSGVDIGANDGTNEVKSFRLSFGPFRYISTNAYTEMSLRLFSDDYSTERYHYQFHFNLYTGSMPIQDGTLFYSQNSVEENYVYNVLQSLRDSVVSAYNQAYQTALDSNTQSIYDNGYTDGYDSGYNAAETDLRQDYNNAYQNGYNVGFESAESFYTSAQGTVYNNGYNAGYGEGYVAGEDSVNVGQIAYDNYQEGYVDGLNAGSNRNETVSTIFSGILQVAMVPVNFFLSIFNFEILGINLSAFIRAIFTVVLTIIVLKTVLGKGGGSSDN